MGKAQDYLNLVSRIECDAEDSGTSIGAYKGWITRRMRAGVFVDNTDAKIVSEMKERVRSWLSKKNVDWAKGKTRDEIFAHFDSELKPISVLPPKYLAYLKKGIYDNRVYCSEGYLVEHAVNHHPEVDPKEYDDIQDIINTPDDVKLDDRDGSKRSVVFVKDVGKFAAVVVGVSLTSNDMIVFHKTFFKKKKNAPYQKLRSI